MDVHDKLDELTDLVETARAMPLSSSCVLNRTEVLELLDEVRALLPRELEQAESLLRGRDELVAEGQATAAALVEAGRAEQQRLVGDTEVVRVAREDAAALLAQAQAESDEMREQTDAYVDAKLANFEIALEKTMETVQQGRKKIHGRRELEDLSELSDGFEDEDPLPQH